LCQMKLETSLPKKFTGGGLVHAQEPPKRCKWRWQTQFKRSKQPICNGTYQVYVYPLQSWADSNGTTPFSIGLENTSVGSYTPGTQAGVWTKLGPYTVTVSDGTLNLTTSGGTALLAGIEVWRVGGGGGTTATPTATRTPTLAPTATRTPLLIPTSTPIPNGAYGFYGALNLGGNSGTMVDGELWETGAYNAEAWFALGSWGCGSSVFIPAVSVDRAEMLNCYGTGPNIEIEWLYPQEADYWVYLDLYQAHVGALSGTTSPLTIMLEGNEIGRFQFSQRFEWERVGPFPVHIGADHTLNLYGTGNPTDPQAAPVISGIELYINPVTIIYNTQSPGPEPRGAQGQQIQGQQCRASNTSDWRWRLQDRFDDNRFFGSGKQRPTGTQGHHGVMSAWMRRIFGDRYAQNDAPVLLMPYENHQGTRTRFSAHWQSILRGQYPAANNDINWASIDPWAIYDISEDLFNFANPNIGNLSPDYVVGGTPQNCRNLYWRRFGRYVRELVCQIAFSIVDDIIIFNADFVGNRAAIQQLWTFLRTKTMSDGQPILNEDVCT
jgi:hypothetical protein